MEMVVQLLSVYAWPLTILFAIWHFKPEVKGLFGSINSTLARGFRAGGIEFLPSQSPSHMPPTPGEDLKEDPLVKPWKAKITEALSQKGVLTGPDAQEHLLNILAASVRYHDLFTTGLFIFGSQIAALRAIHNAGSLPDSALAPFRDTHRARALEAGKPAEVLNPLAWARFFQERLLVELTASGDYKLSEIGRQFLSYADDNGINEATRPY